MPKQKAKKENQIDFNKFQNRLIRGNLKETIRLEIAFMCCHCIKKCNSEKIND